MTNTQDVQRYADALMALIKQDQDTGQVPRDVCSWDELDDSVDAEDYYRLVQLPSGTQEALDLRDAVNKEVSRRLSGTQGSESKMEPTDRHEDVEVLAHIHIRKEQINLEHALQAISDWVSSGTGGGANFLVTRLTGPIGAGSLFGGADISQFTPAGTRGSLDSQGGIAYHLDFADGTHINFPLHAHMDLNKGEVTLNWEPPGQPAHSSAFRLAYVQRLASHGPTYFFDTEQATDEAVYSLTVVLLQP